MSRSKLSWLPSLGDAMSVPPCQWDRGLLFGHYELVDGNFHATPVATAGTAARAAWSCVRKSRATFSAIAMVVSIVTLDGGVGMIDASATLRLETPRTAPVASTTACGSLRGPMRTVPLAWL